MQDIYYITDLEQLKVISDPLRIKILWEIDESAKTGKMIADRLEIPAPKIHYHLKELERVGLVNVVRTEEKNGILQKFYRPVAKTISLEKVLPHQKQEVSDDLSESFRENVLTGLEKTKSLAKKVDDAVFTARSSFMQWYTNVYLTPEQTELILGKLKDIHEVVSPAQKEGERDGTERFHLSLLGFPIIESPYPEEDE